MANNDVKYIEYGELSSIAESHPTVYEAYVDASGNFAKFDSLANSPDIYDEFPIFFYLEYNGKLVSYISTLPDLMFFQDSSYSWAWGGDLFSDPSYRGKGLATLLVKGMVEVLHNRKIAWGGVFSTPTALHIYKKLGYNILDYVDRFIFLKSAKPVLKRHVKSEAVVDFIDVLIRPLLKCVIAVLKDSNIDKSNITSIEVLDHSELDRLNDKKIVYFSKFHFNDSFCKLKYKIGMKETVKIYIIHDRNTREALAYYVLSNRYIRKPLGDYSHFNLMTLMDFGFFKKDARIFEYIVNEVFKAFSVSAAEALEVISSYNILSSLLKKRMMVKVGSGMSFKFTLPSTWKLDSSIDSVESWHLTHFSGDAFGFE